MIHEGAYSRYVKNAGAVYLKRECDHWSVCFSVECGMQPLPEPDTVVGIDVGLTPFATLSGEEAKILATTAKRRRDFVARNVV